MAVLFALLSSGLWGTSDFCGGTLTRRLPAVAVAVMGGVIGLVGLIVVAAATGAFTAPTGYVGWSLLGAVAGSCGVVAFYQALAIGTMGVVAPIAALGVLVPVVAGLVQGDRPTLLQDVGIVVAIAGVVLAGGPELQRGEDRAVAATSLWLAAVAAVGFGVAFVAIDHGARTSIVMTLLVMRGAAAVALVGIAAATATSLRVGVADLPMLGVVGAFDVGANATFAYASRHGLLSVVAVLSSLYPAVTVILARVVHAERLVAVQLAGVLAALGGVVLIAS